MRFTTLIQFILIIMTSMLLFIPISFAETNQNPPLTQSEIIDQLGWIQTGENRCGGHYIEAPFHYPETLLKTNAIQITSNELLFAQHGTSIGQGKVTISRFGQQIIANKAYLYRDPATGKISAIELFDQVTLREPNSLIKAAEGRFVIKTKAQYLRDILYRTAIYSATHKAPALPTNTELQETREVSQLSAWGQAKAFTQEVPHIYEFDQASYSTCPPTRNTWRVKASHITLNKETGRGTATHARILVKGIPVFYTPYLNFPIDSRRKTGFLWPNVGTNSLSGPYFSLPFYWNLAPNYDTMITPAFLSKRGLQLTDNTRYLTEKSSGNINLQALPNDKNFGIFQNTSQNQFQSSTNPVTQSELRRLENASTTRKSLEWINITHFNEHWSDAIDYNWVSDDYYLRDFSNNLNQVTQNQLLQQAELNYKGQNWNFMGRIQGYQTMHPVDESVQVNNQYTRAPQLALNGNYPDNPYGLDYFIDNDLTRFDIRSNPGSLTKMPMGNRLNIQPGVSRAFTAPYFSVRPRLQFALTEYRIGDVTSPNTSDPSRALPIFDVDSGMYFDRHITFLHKGFRQTLEPRAYYTYIPFREQNQIPIFDTTVNTLTYDQLFLYNRFSGLDRINDANQVALGLTSRFIDDVSGTEKVKLALGQIIYFRKRSVTLCSGPLDPTCPINPADAPAPTSVDFPGTSENERNRSPLSGLLNYTVNPNWSATFNTIWNPQSNHVDNQSIGLHFQPPNTEKIVNLGYNFVRNGDQLPGESLSSASNLSQTDLSTSWPILHDWSALGRWTQNWNHHHFQNLLYGLQYDSCCWAIRFVTGRTFTGLNLNNIFQYNTQFYIQFALKGLGSVPVTGGDPNQLLTSSISGYQNNFGRDF